MGADFRQGLLAIKLEVIIPENQRPRKVEINGSNTIKDPQLLNEETINATDKTLHG